MFVGALEEVFLVDCVVVVGWLEWSIFMSLGFGWSGEGFRVVGKVRRVVVSSDWSEEIWVC